MGKKANQRREKQDPKDKKVVVIPYIKGLSEWLSKVYQKYWVTTAMRPHTTLRKLLVHPKDKVKKLKNNGVVYKIPCKNCNHSYIGETGRSLGVRLEEHKKDCENQEKRSYTRTTTNPLLTQFYKSTVTVQKNKYNHISDWKNTTVVSKESVDKVRRIKEAIAIRCTSKNINKDDGATTIIHACMAAIFFHMKSLIRVLLLAEEVTEAAK